MMFSEKNLLHFSREKSRIRIWERREADSVDLDIQRAPINCQHDVFSIACAMWFCCFGLQTGWFWRARCLWECRLHECNFTCALPRSQCLWMWCRSLHLQSKNTNRLEFFYECLGDFFLLRYYKAHWRHSLSTSPHHISFYRIYFRLGEENEVL